MFSSDVKKNAFRKIENECRSRGYSFEKVMRLSEFDIEHARQPMILFAKKVEASGEGLKKDAETMPKPAVAFYTNTGKVEFFEYADEIIK